LPGNSVSVTHLLRIALYVLRQPIKARIQLNWLNDGSWILDSRHTKKILVIAPHADDEVLGMGGTIAQARDAGISVKVALLTRRDSAIKNFEESSRQLGFEAVTELPELPGQAKRGTYEDGTLANHKMELTDRLKLLLRMEKPEIVFGPHRKERHLDHQIASWSLAYATWRVSRIHPDEGPPHRVKWLFYYEISGPYANPAFLVALPNRFLVRKRRALLDAYGTEMRRSPDYLLHSLHNAILRGLQLESPSEIKKRINFEDIAKATTVNEGMPAAEAFFL
jgi:LmbE family N-acetylglucosaminyl deacetylase